MTPKGAGIYEAEAEGPSTGSRGRLTSGCRSGQETSIPETVARKCASPLTAPATERLCVSLKKMLHVCVSPREMLRACPRGKCYVCVPAENAMCVSPWEMLRACPYRKCCVSPREMLHVCMSPREMLCVPVGNAVCPCRKCCTCVPQEMLRAYLSAGNDNMCMSWQRPEHQDHQESPCRAPDLTSAPSLVPSTPSVPSTPMGAGARTARPSRGQVWPLDSGEAETGQSLLPCLSQGGPVGLQGGRRPQTRPRPRQHTWSRRVCRGG